MITIGCPLKRANRQPEIALTIRVSGIPMLPSVLSSVGTRNGIVIDDDGAIFLGSFFFALT